MKLAALSIILAAAMLPACLADEIRLPRYRYVGPNLSERAFAPDLTDPKSGFLSASSPITIETGDGNNFQIPNGYLVWPIKSENVSYIKSNNINVGFWSPGQEPILKGHGMLPPKTQAIGDNEFAVWALNGTKIVKKQNGLPSFDEIYMNALSNKKSFDYIIMRDGSGIGPEVKGGFRIISQNDSRTRFYLTCLPHPRLTKDVENEVCEGDVEYKELNYKTYMVIPKRYYKRVWEAVDTYEKLLRQWSTMQ